MRILSTLVLLFAAVAGCAGGGNYWGHECVSAGVEERMGQPLGPCAAEATCPCDAPVGRDASPPGVDVQDGLTEDEAITLALWNNAHYQELLAQLGITWADLVRARQLANPELTALFPVGPKEWELALAVPLDALIQRPRRVALAEIESRRVAQQLVQEALNVVRDVRVAYADWQLAFDRVTLARQSQGRRDEILRRATAGVKAGDISPLDASAATVYHLRGQDELAQATFQWEQATRRLRLLMGSPLADCPLTPVPCELLPLLHADLCWDDLVAQALTSRPDLIAAEDAMSAAEQRARLAHIDYITFRAILPDFKSKGEKGGEAGPGMDLTLPIFHQNQGAILRAEAELEQARRHYATLRDAAVFEVRDNAGRFLYARQTYQLVSHQITPQAASAFQTTERAYFERTTTLPQLLELSRQVDETAARRAELSAVIRRSAAELERGVGRRIFLAAPQAPLAMAQRRAGEVR